MKKPVAGKKKLHPTPAGLVSGEILENARKSLSTDKLAMPAKLERCVVCGSEAAPSSTEQLCWVCRRLKISAWMENDQMPAQE